MTGTFEVEVDGATLTFYSIDRDHSLSEGPFEVDVDMGWRGQQRGWGLQWRRPGGVVGLSITRVETYAGRGRER